MNSSENNPVNQLSENSELTIKRDLLVVNARFAAQVAEVERSLYSDREGFAASLRAAMDPGAGLIEQAIERMEVVMGRRTVGMLIGRDVEMTFVLAEELERLESIPTFSLPADKQTRSYQYEGIVNDPKTPPASAGGGRRGILGMVATLETLGYSGKDVVVIGSGGRCSQFDYSVFDDAQVVPHDVDLSPHPGERHRQLSRKLTSSRSRAGKAARWSS